ncbi:MAG: phospholipase D-like domain-containing protein [Coprobacillaceae bacterium]
MLRIFILYILIGFLIPHIFPKWVSKKSKKNLKVLDINTSTTGPDKALLIEEPVDAFSIRIQMIRSAKKTIDFVCYAMQNGQTTNVYLEEILNAANRGVIIRILLDAKVGIVDRTLALKMRAISFHKNVTYHTYNTLSLLKPWNWNNLLHDKFLLVDDTYLLLGGRNIGDRFFAPNGFKEALTNDREVFIHNTNYNNNNSVLHQIKSYLNKLLHSKQTTQKIYPFMLTNKQYNLAIYSLQEESKKCRQMNPQYYQKSFNNYLKQCIPTNKIILLHNPIGTGKKEPWIAYQLTKLANRTKRSILLQTPYSTANPFLLKTIKKLTNKVESLVMVTNSLASSPNYPAFSNYWSQRKKFVDNGVSIYEYQSNDSIHGKSIVFDDHLSAVGSFNMDDRSFYINTELMLVINSKAFASMLKKAILAYKKSSLLVNSNNTYEASTQVVEKRVPFYKRLLMKIISIFSRILQSLI